MRRFLLLIVLLFPLMVSAKESPPKKRVCRVMFLNASPDSPKKLFLFDGTTSLQVDLPRMNLSDIYTIPAGELTLHLTPDEVKKPEQIPSGAPSAQVSASSGDIYLMITPDPTNTVAPVRLQIMDAGKEKFRKGQILWYNLTTSQITGQLGSQKLDLAGQGQAVITDPAKTNESFEVSLSYLRPDDSVPHPICQTQWVHDSNSRMVMLVHSGEDNDVPQISGFKDFREKSK